MLRRLVGYQICRNLTGVFYPTIASYTVLFSDEISNMKRKQRQALNDSQGKDTEESCSRPRSIKKQRQSTPKKLGDNPAKFVLKPLLSESLTVGSGEVKTIHSQSSSSYAESNEIRDKSVMDNVLTTTGGNETNILHTSNNPGLETRAHPQIRRIYDDNDIVNSMKGIQGIVLISCGAYNPITNMHLRMFEISKDYIRRKFPTIQKISGMISPVADAYGKKGLKSAVHRLKMCNLAIENSSWIGVTSWESEQSKWTPSAEVLHHMREHLNKGNQDTRLMLVCGADLLESFVTPNLWLDEDIQTIIREFGLIVIDRINYNPSKLVYENDLLHSLQSNIHILTDWINNDVSSTKVRRALGRNNSVKYLVPDAVLNYIQEHGLYKFDPEEAKTDCILAPYKRNR